jgi:predicted SAM-dependent methyltransferase
MEKIMFKNVFLKIIRSFGYEIIRTDKGIKSILAEGQNTPNPHEKYSQKLKKLEITKVHYGSGGHLFGEGWINVDRNSFQAPSDRIYMSADLASEHPFPSDQFQFGFAEDFLEHLTQEESIIFLSEAFRCLRKGGVLRLSFPGLRGVLKRHYRSGGYEGASIGREEAYTMWGHKHFYCEESLALIAEHIGFSKIKFVQFGLSDHEELIHLDFRADQQDLNIYVELTK